MNQNDTPNGRFPGYRDRPKKFLYDYLKKANANAAENPNLVDEMRHEFLFALEFVRKTFKEGFRKTPTANTVPRVRFEAIAVGTALALREKPGLHVEPEKVSEKMRIKNFDRIVVSDGANVRSRLEGRIDLVKDILVEE